MICCTYFLISEYFGHCLLSSLSCYSHFSFIIVSCNYCLFHLNKVGSWAHQTLSLNEKELSPLSRQIFLSTCPNQVECDVCFAQEVSTARYNALGFLLPYLLTTPLSLFSSFLFFFVFLLVVVCCCSSNLF